MIARNELICKNCGAPIDTSTAQGGVVRCNYCRSAFTLPKEGGAAREFLYQGEHELDTCEFDRAYSAYRKAAETDPNEPEAYFGMALASFKVQYIKDGVNNCLQPIARPELLQSGIACHSRTALAIRPQGKGHRLYSKRIPVLTRFGHQIRLLPLHKGYGRERRKHSGKL